MTEPRRFPEGFLEEIRRRTSLVTLIGAELMLRRAGRDWEALCPFHSEKTASFTVCDRKGWFHCFGCGAHGDCFAWCMRYANMTFPEAVDWLAREAGLSAEDADAPRKPLRAAVPRPSPRDLDDEDRKEIEKAVQRWREAQPAAGTLVEAYLASRSILVDRIGGMPPSLRFAPSLPYYVKREASGRWEVIGEWPAMVAGVQGPDGRVRAVHLTYLAPDGHGKAQLGLHPDTGAKLRARKMRGKPYGGAVRFAPAAKCLVLGEGNETVLSVRVVRPELAGWAGLSLGNLAGAGVRELSPRPHPERPKVTLPARDPDMSRPGLVLPDEVEEVILLGEAENGDPHAYQCLFDRACRRFHRLGLKVRAGVPPVGDFNDWLMSTMGRAA